MHEREAAEHGLRCEYRLLDLEVLNLTAGALPDLLNEAERNGYAGLNITHPCKQTVLPLLTEVSHDAAAIGAVNTVVFQAGKRTGNNTDWLGFRAGLLRGLPDAALNHVVQLGAGGAGAATAYALLKMGAGRVSIIDSDHARAQSLAEHYANLFGPERITATTDLESALAAANGIVHATPTGMKSHPGLPLPVSLLRRDLWLAEIVYFPLETELLRAAKAVGCRTVDGSGMAVHQAIEAFQLFTGLEADTARMHAHFLAQVLAQIES
jgi:shikimate dehydrogenase